MGCGGGSTDPNAPNTSGLTKRVYATNSFSGVINIIDASNDVFSNHLFSISGAQPQQMSLALDRSVTLLWNQAAFQIGVLNNSTEQPAGGVTVSDRSDSFVALNNTNGFAVVRNNNQLLVLDLQKLTILQLITIPTPKKLVLSGDGKKLLVMSDTVPDTVYVVDTATAATAPGNAVTTVTDGINFDHPVYAVFSSDNSKAYVLNCGPECGGAAASVVQLDMSATPPVVVNNSKVNVPGGATVALLDSSTLWVAGNDNAVPAVGHLTKVNTSTTPMTADAPVVISDGLHGKMGLGTHSKLFIGSRACTNARCLTVYDTSSNTVFIEQQDPNNPNSPGFGDVKGIQPISGRDRVYLAQGTPSGEIRIFDTTTGLPLPNSQQLDAVGNIEDVLQVDP